MEKNKTVEGGSRLKVKKFRIRPRIPSVKKILKQVMGVSKVPSDIEETIPSEIDAFLERAVPLAFYETWAGDEIPDTYRLILVNSGHSKAISVSALVATVGAAPEEYLSEILMAGETTRSNLVTALSEESADLSLNFLLKLLAEDAKQDDCEIGEPILIKDEAVLAETLELLNASDEGVSLDTAFHLSPRFTRVGLVPWIPTRKKKKSSSVAKKK